MDTDSHTELGWLWLSVFCSVYTVGECLSTLERWEPQWWFLDRWMVKTGFCQRDFSMTNEQQRHLMYKLIIELLEEVDSIKTSLKICFLPPSKNVITSLTLASELSSLLFVNKTYRVLLLQGWQIYCPTLLIPEMGKGTLFKGGV